MDGLLPHLPWMGALLASVFLAVLRRTYTETPQTHFLRVFSGWKTGTRFDPKEKLRCIQLTLALLSHLARILWIALFLITPVRMGDWTRLGLWVPALLIMSLLLLEVLPQALTTSRGERIALAHLRWLSHLETALSPLVRGVRRLHRALVRLLGRGRERTEADVAEEGIRAAVEQGEREGVLLEGEKSMIESMLEFHDVEVTEVMTPRTEMVAIEATTTIQQALPQVIACGHSRIPVYRENIDNIVGILYTKDLLRYVTDPQQGQLLVEQILRRIYFVPETKKIRELLAEFRAQRFHIAIVLDEYGGTTGLVTIEDIIEEIVGEIEDEYDAARTQLIRAVSPGTYDVDGRVHIDELSKTLGVELPECDDYDTLAGFIFSSLGKVPREGESFEFDCLRFQITAADERKIKRVRVKILKVQGQDLVA